MNNDYKIKIVLSKIDAIEKGLEWLADNTSEGSFPNGKLSAGQQISDLISQKNALLQVLNNLQ